MLVLVGMATIWVDTSTNSTCTIMGTVSFGNTEGVRDLSQFVQRNISRSYFSILLQIYLKTGLRHYLVVCVCARARVCVCAISFSSKRG